MIIFVKNLTISRNLSVVHYVARNFTCDVIWLKGRKTSMKMHTNSLWNMKELTNHSVVSNSKRISICHWVWRSMKEFIMVVVKMHERTLNSENHPIVLDVISISVCNWGGGLRKNWQGEKTFNDYRCEKSYYLPLQSLTQKKSNFALG